MKRNGKTCDDIAYLSDKCNLPNYQWRKHWSDNKYCQSSCWGIGPYDGDACEGEQALQLAGAFVGKPYVVDPSLTAYRDKDSCGQMGKDYQSEWCHGSEMSELGCKSPVLSQHCETGTATLVSLEGDGKSFSLVNIEGCGYAFFAQYVCDEASTVTGFCRYGDNENENLDGKALVDGTGKGGCKQQCQTTVDCTAYAFTSENSHCDLYKGGPYTYGSGAHGVTCSILQDEDQLFLDPKDMQDGEGSNGTQSGMVGAINGATYFGTSLVVPAMVALMSSLE